MPKTYRVMNPRRTPTGALACPSARDLMILDGVKYSEGDEYTPPPGKDIEHFVARGFLKEVGAGSKRARGAAKAEKPTEPEGKVTA